MKNIEREEVQELLCKYLDTGTFSVDEFERLGCEYGCSTSEFSSWLKAEYVEPIRYYWHIESFKEHGYLNFYLGYNYITVDANDEFSYAVRTKFTESEYRELSEQFGFDFNMFEREDID